MRLPDCQNNLIARVAAVQKNTVVVLHTGAPVECPWAGDVSAVLCMYLAGEGIGEATDALLWGEANPCGRLPETWPLRLEDTPLLPGLSRRRRHRRLPGRACMWATAGTTGAGCRCAGPSATG